MYVEVGANRCDALPSFEVITIAVQETQNVQAFPQIGPSYCHVEDLNYSELSEPSI